MFINLSFIIILCVGANSYKLEKVVVLSRHGIRTPLTSNLEAYTQKHWPVWNADTGFLTQKGGLLERYMGKYFFDWLIHEKLFNDNCPSDEVFVYANTRQRTKESAKSFVDGAFCNCVRVYYKNISTMDPVFNPVIRNTSQVFKKIVLKELQIKLNRIDLKEPLLKLEKILDFKNSPVCKNEKICDLVKTKNKIEFELNKEPDVSGPLMIANDVIDAFVMAYYEGMSSNDIAWGSITTNEQWANLLSILNAYHDLRFKTNILDKDLAHTFLKYMTDILLHGEKKFYLLVGHDSNINSLLSSLKFKNYNLPNQYEKTPIGGKVVFQKWYDEENKQHLLRVNYVYQSMQQLRDGDVLTLENPPQWAVLEMKNCDVDENGFCSWDDFVNILNVE